MLWQNEKAKKDIYELVSFVILEHEKVVKGSGYLGAVEYLYAEFTKRGGEIPPKSFIKEMCKEVYDYLKSEGKL